LFDISKQVLAVFLLKLTFLENIEKRPRSFFRVFRQWCELEFKPKKSKIEEGVHRPNLNFVLWSVVPTSPSSHFDLVKFFLEFPIDYLQNLLIHQFDQMATSGAMTFWKMYVFPFFKTFTSRSRRLSSPKKKSCSTSFFP
jgi:hypothetical protein